MLLDLHSTFLGASALNSAQQTAIFIGAHSFIKQSQISSAVQLLWLAGSTAQMTWAVQEQIANQLEQGLLQHLADTLPAVQHCSPAVHALLQCITKLAELATQQQLQLLLTNKTHQEQILSAACASTLTASAATKLLLLLASRGLHAAALLQPLAQANCVQTTAAAVLNVRSWITTAMPPLLQQMHQHLTKWPHVDPTDAKAAPLPVLSVPQQQLGLLLCCVVAIYQAAASGISPDILHEFFKGPVAESAVQAVLLSTWSPKLQCAAIQMVNQLAALSAQLARCCFQAVAPIVGQLLSQHVTSNSSSSSSCRHNGFTAKVAAEAMWKELLKRVTDTTALEAAMASSLHAAAAAVAFQAKEITPAGLDATANYDDAATRSSSSNGGASSMMPYVSAFLSLAISYSCYDKPLLPNLPQHTVAGLMLHLPQLIRLTAAAPAVLLEADNSRQKDPAGGLVDVKQLESVLLLSFWMLHSLVDAIHKLDLLSTGAAMPDWTEAATAAAISAATALISAQTMGNVSPGSGRCLYMQTAAIQLVRSILKASECSSIGKASEVTWHDMAAALAGFVATAGQSLGASVAKRQLLCAASQLARDLAVQKPHLLAQSLAGNTVDSSSSSSNSGSSKAGAVSPCILLHEQVFNSMSPCSTELAPSVPARSVAEKLQRHLEAVLAELQQRKLERSSSGQELLAAVEDALHVIKQQDVHTLPLGS